MTAHMYSDGRYLRLNPGWHTADSPYKARTVEKAIARTRVSFTSCVDVGCGAGQVTQILARRFPESRFVGCDLAEDAASLWPPAPPPNLTFVRGDPLGLRDTFDVALCLDVFEHVDDYVGFLRALRPLATRHVFHVPLDLSLAKLATGGLRRARERVGHLHYFSRYTALATLEHCGYRLVDSFLSPGFRTAPVESPAQVAMMMPRLALSLLGPRLASVMAGGYSLVVVADGTAP
jgi:SAM-dependent methyltransferase